MIRRCLVVLATMCTAVAVPAGVDAGPSKPALPRATVRSGFTDSGVATVAAATTVHGLPDGRVVVLSKGFSATTDARIIVDGVLQETPLVTLPVCTESERGLLGFTSGPDFNITGHVYIFYTREVSGTCVNRVSRFTMAGNTINPGTERVLLDNVASTNANHNGGDLEFGNDGYLYVAIGDAGCDPRGNSGCASGNDAGQDLSLLNGKILRISGSSGLAAPGNPFVGGANATNCRLLGTTAAPTARCTEIYAWGLRNPWRIAADPNTGGTRIFVNDVGQGNREEVNLLARGANYGWPEREGKCETGFSGASSLCPPPSASSGYTQPIADYSHNPAHLDFGGTYITAGSFIPNGAWPSQYDGGYLFADGGVGNVYFRSASGSVNYAVPFASEAGGITDMAAVLEPDGWAMYYVLGSPLAGQPQNVRKITFNASAPASPGALAYTALDVPQRAFDSRNAGAITGALRGGTTRLVGLNPPSGAVAALANVSLVKPIGNGFAAGWTPRAIRPTVSVVNAPSGAVVGNTSLLPMAGDGSVVVMSSSTSHVVVDVLGWYTAAPGAVGAGRFVAVNPSRAFNTRNPSASGNQYTETQGSGEKVARSTIVGVSGVPATADAVVLSVTAIAGSSGGGNVVVHPAGGAVPTTANVTVVASDVRTNLVVVPVSATGAVDFRMRSGVVDVIVDVQGYITGNAANPSTAGRLVPINPTREVNTLQGLGFGRLSANAIGVRNPTSVPNNAAGIVQNITVTRTSGAGFITSYSSTTAAPTVSNGNVTGAGQTRGVLAYTTLGAGAAAYRPSMSTDVIVDMFGYFTV
jgi:glucose/arabinose dehydrogenase